ncbi:MAG: hypothetical protein AB7Q17_17680 [Phycisphaerae bacterium]
MPHQDFGEFAMVVRRAVPLTLLLLAGRAMHAAAFPPGHLYVHEQTREGCLQQENWIRQIDPETGESWIIAGYEQGLCTNNGMAFTPAGRYLYILNYSGDNILALDSDGVVSVRYSDIVNPYSHTGPAWDRFGNFYFASESTWPMMRIRLGSQVAEFVIDRTAGGGPVARTPTDEIMTSMPLPGHAGALALVTSDGQVSQFGPAEGAAATALAIDRRGNIFASGAPGIVRYDRMDPTTRRLLPATFFGDRAFAFSDDERTLWVADWFGVYAADPNTGSRREVFRFPTGHRGGRGIAVYIPPKPGDLNCDKRVNHFDIDPFVVALVDAEFYQQNYGWCRRDLADVNRDGEIDVFDVDAFVDAVVSQSDR